jgi:diacylglycerol kinase (ATP)
VDRRIGVLLNPASGKGRVSRLAPDLVAALSARGDEVVVLQGDSVEDAHRRVAEVVGSLDALVAVGGDGTVHMALQHVVGADLPLGIIPVGTGNDGAAAIGLAHLSVTQAAEIVLDGHTRRVDLGHVRAGNGVERFYLCVLSTGFDAMVTERANRMSRALGDSRYVLATLATLRTFQPIDYEARIEGEVRRDRAMFVAVGNGPTYGGGMRICDGTDMNDGTLSLVWIHTLSRVQLLRLFPTVYSGAHLDHPGVLHRQVREVELAAEGQMAYADGEYVGPLPVTVRAVPDGVRVLVPR